MQLKYYRKNNQIFGVAYIKGKRIQFATGQHIHDKYWNASKHRAKVTREYRDAGSLNEFLDSLEAEYNNIVRKATLGSSLSGAAVKEAVLQYLGRGEKKPVTLLEMFDNFIEAKRERYVKGTIDNFTAVRKTIVRYGEITDFDDYVGFLFREGKPLKKGGFAGYNRLSVRRNIAIIRQVLKYHKVFCDFTFKADMPDTIYLTPEEIDKLANVKTRTKIERDILTMFLYECHTGLRHSDVWQVKAENVQNGILFAKMKKTGGDVMVPIHPRLLELDPPTYHPTNIANKYLKNLAKRAGLNEVVHVKDTHGGSKKIVSSAKWKLISTHTGRRSFVTNALLAGVPAVELRSLSGHSNESSFKRYNRVTKQQNADKLKSHPFFR